MSDFPSTSNYQSNESHHPNNDHEFHLNNLTPLTNNKTRQNYNSSQANTSKNFPDFPSTSNYQSNENRDRDRDNNIIMPLGYLRIYLVIIIIVKQHQPAAANYNARMNLSQSSSRSNEEREQRVQHANFNPINDQNRIDELYNRFNELQRTLEEYQTTTNYPTVYVCVF